MWDLTNGEGADGAVTDANAGTVSVNGSEYPVAGGSPFGETILEAARESGLGKFRVFIGAEEVKPEDAPATIEAGMRVELAPFDVAGA